MGKVEAKSPGVPSSDDTLQQQQQKQPAQQPTLPIQQNSQTLQQQGHPLQPSNNTQMASGGAAAPPCATASGGGRRISYEDLQLVQNLIERCLQLYMNRAEVINTLLNQAKIEPNFSGLVWQKLEEQNSDFFKAYYVQLKLKRQIMLFNHFLEQHAQLVHPARAPLASLHNGLHTTPVYHMPICYPVPTSHPHNVPTAVALPSPPGVGVASIHEAFGAARGSPGSNGDGNVSRILTASSFPLSNDLSTGLAQGSSTFPFNAMQNPTIDVSGVRMDVPASFPSDASFHAAENHAQNGMGALQITTDADASGGREPLGLGRNLSLWDLTAELANTSDIFEESYSGSCFLPPAFLGSPDDEKMLDQITDPCGYDDFEDEK